MTKQELIESIVENNRDGIDSNVLESIVLKYAQNPQMFDIREVTVPGEKTRIDGTRSDSITLKNQVDLIKRIIDDVSENLNGYTSQTDMQKFYSERGMTADFALSKQDLSRLFSLTNQDITNYYQTGNSSSLPEDITTILDTMKKGIDYEEEHIGATKQESVISPFYDVQIDSETKSTYDYRIYMNSPQTNEMEQFLNEYIYECYKRRIPYDMKGIRNQSADSKDGTVLYATTGLLGETVEALKAASEKSPEILKKFGQPVHLTGDVPYLNKGDDQWCGISHRGGNTNMQTYNDFMNSNIQLSMIHAMAKNSNKYGDQFRAFLKRSFSEEDLQSFLNAKDITLVSEGLNVSKKFKFKNMSEGNLIESLVYGKSGIQSAMQTVISNIMSDKDSKAEFLNQFGESLQKFSVMRNLQISDIEQVPNINPCIGATMFYGLSENEQNRFINDKPSEEKGESVSLKSEIIEAAKSDPEYTTSLARERIETIRDSVIAKRAEKSAFKKATDKELEESKKISENKFRQANDFEL